ncbi:MAG TPA: hypothetical protein VFI22_06430, partial [Thermomicrobiales bacterium]|nr:hypothetical protein [Thermomicrobiales bacterium]
MRLEKSRLFTRRRIGGALIGALAVGGAFTLATLHARQLNPSYFGDLHWRNIGPPRSGYISSPAGVPGDPTTYYAGTPEGGVWKSTNGGVTWKPIFDSVHVASIGAVAVAPSDHNVVYAGTGNQSSWSFTTGKGVYRSADAGKTWTNVGLPNSQYIGGMVVDPRDANHVLVAAMGAGGGRGARAGGAGAAPAQPTAPPEVGERGVYRTTDGGKTWTRVVGDGTTGATDVWLDFGDPQICYALLQVGGTGGFAGAPAVQGQPPTGNTGIYKS